MPARTDLLTRLLRPSSVAVIGASAKRAAAGNELLANLREERYDGSLSVVHPAGGEIDGIKAVQDVAALPADLDVAIVSLPAPSVTGVLRELEQAGCATALVPSTGFGAEVEREFREFVAETSMLVHGPNNMGVINLTDRIPLWIQHRGVSRLRAGNVGLVAQSGSAAIFVPRASRDGLFSTIVSSGSEWQTTAADYIEWLAQDDATEVIGLVLESIGDPDQFRAAVGSARAAGKPLAVLKVGRSDDGRRATLAHTGALAAPDDTYRALFGELDIPMLDDYDELAGVLEAYSRPRTRRSAGVRFAATTISGGQSALLADLAATRGVIPAPLADETRARLLELIPGGSPTVPVDTGGGTNDHSDYAAIVRALEADPGVDAVVIVSDAQDTLSLAELEVESGAWNAVNAVYPDASKPILFASTTGQSINPRFRDEVVVDAPIIRGLGPALAVVRAMAMNRAPVVPRAEVARDGVDESALARLLDEVRAASGALTPDLATRMLAAYGIATIGSHVVQTPGEVATLDALTFPVVAKVRSASIAHRTEAGCVITSIADAGALRDAVATILDRAHRLVGAGAVDGVEIQPQLSDELQAVVGFTSDPVHGGYVIAGSGGVLVELLDDVAGAIAPFGSDRADELIGATRFATRMAGYRGLVPPTETGPLAELVSRVSLLADDFRGLVTELDLNPVLVQPGDGRPVVVDALLVAAPASPITEGAAR